MKKIAIVTGANKGLGFETCRELGLKGYTVILTARSEDKGRAAAEKLKKEGLDVSFHKLDVTSSDDISALSRFVEKQYGRLDVLVNNAGMFIREDSAFEGKVDNIRTTMETNVYGAFQLCQKLIPVMRKNKYGRVVNVSSGMGQLSEMNGGYPSYRISKTALNAVTRIFADETQGENILVNSICPGWVKTDMGGAGAERSIPEGADVIVWAATLPDGGPTGGYFRDREPLAW